MFMNIRTRTLSGFALAIALLGLSGLHVLWALGNPFPASSFAQLERTVLPAGQFPSAPLTILVAGALFVASALAVLRTLDLNRGRADRSKLLRLAIYALGAIFALRAIEGFVSGIAWLAAGGTSSDRNALYHYADLAAFSPLCLAIATAAFLLAGQSRVPRDLFQHTLSVFRRVPFVHLVTLAADGSPRSRVLQRITVEANGTVWMATDAGSEKVEEIRADPRVVLSAYEAKAQSAASLEGIATVVTDSATLAEHWVPLFRLYFPRGKFDERYALIRVVPASFGLIDFSWDVAPAPFGLRRVSQPVPSA